MRFSYPFCGDDVFMWFRTLEEGTSYVQQIVVNAGTGPISYYVSNGPSGMDVNSSGVVTWEDAVGSVTPWQVNVVVYNSISEVTITW
jgi:hypothetical protein